MKKAILIPFLLIIATTFGQENLIKNGGFENDFKHWINIVENGADASFSTDSKNKQIGSSALKVQVTTLGKKTWNVQTYQSFVSEKNKNYEISFLAKSNLANKEITILVQNKTFTQKIFTLSNKWKVYTWQFIAKEDKLQFSMHFLRKGTFYIDNLIVKEVKRVRKRIWKNSSNRKIKKADVIANGNFEQDLSDWFNLSIDHGEVIYKLNTQTPNEGKNAMSVEVIKLGANPWSIQSVKKINVKKNKRYLATFYAKADSKNKLVKAQIQDLASEIYLPFEFTTNTDDWEKHEFEFTAGSNNMNFIFHHMNLGTIEYDNINIQMIR